MMIKRVAFAAVAAALPLTVLAATPASARDSGHDNGRNHFKLSVEVDKYDHNKKVKVTANCKEKDDHWGSRDRRGGHNETADLKVTFRDRDKSYDVDCDGDDHEFCFEVKSRRDSEFKAVL
jgi:hypothetical protein